jgi:hypothetical protein
MPLEDVPLGERTKEQSGAAGTGAPAEALAGLVPGWAASYISGTRYTGEVYEARSPFAGTAGSVGSGGSVGRQTVEDPPPPGTYATYRAMRSHPTVALARAVAFAPVLGAEWEAVKRDPSVPDELLDYVKENYLPFERPLKGQALRALDFGWRGMEQIWEVRPWNGRAVAVPAKFKPLRPEVTAIMRDARGGFAGFEQEKVRLPVDRCLLYSYDDPAGIEDDDYYGRARHENIREWAWWHWVLARRNLHRLGYKVSSMIPVVKGPVSGVEETPNGTVKGMQIAQAIAMGIVTGRGVYMDNLIAGAEDLADVDSLSKASRWSVELLDTGSGATATAGMIDSLRYDDANIMRGWLLPERTALEGQYGTKAEAGEHRDVAMETAEAVGAWIAEGFNWHTVDRGLAWTYGEFYNGLPVRGSVFIRPRKLVDRKLERYRWLVEMLLTNPAVLDVLAATLDLDAIVEELGLPLREALVYTPPEPDDNTGRDVLDGEVEEERPALPAAA